MTLEYNLRFGAPTYTTSESMIDVIKLYNLPLLHYLVNKIEIYYPYLGSEVGYENPLAFAH